MKIVEILPFDFRRKKCSFLEFWAIKCELRETQQVINRVKNFKNMQFRHIKLCRRDGEKMEILCQPIYDNEELPSEFETYESRKVKVPKEEPATLQQARNWSQFWPLHFYTTPFQPLPLNSIETKIFLNLLEWPQIETNHRFCDTTRCQVFDQNNELILTKTPDFEKHELRHAVMCAIDEVSELSRSKKRKHENYLLTDYTVLLLGEPCLMCAFALLHSRIRRIVFKKFRRIGERSISLDAENPVQFLEGTNHTFRVYEIL